MAKKKKRKSGSRKGSNKGKSRKSKRGGMPAWGKLAIVLVAGTVLGTVAENAGLLGKGTVSGPAVGIGLAGFASTGFRRLPAAPVIAAAASAQGFRTVSRTDTYAKIERGAQEVAGKFLSKSPSVARLTPGSDSPAPSGPSYSDTADELTATLDALNGNGAFA